MPLNYDRKLFLLLMIRTGFAVLIFCLTSFRTSAQTIDDYDEVSVAINILQLDNIEITALIKDEKAYLPVTDLFNFIKIANKISLTKDSISGFFVNESATYLMDASKSRVTYNGKVYELPAGELVKFGDKLFLYSDDFGRIFGLNCTFSFRNLSVIVSTELELPIMREQRLSRARNSNFSSSSVAQADTIVKRTYPLFNFGTANWSVINAMQKELPNDTRIYTALGGVIAGGETNVSFNYSSSQGFQQRDQFYSWRLANNENTAVRQIVAGKVFTQTIASLYSPILGATVTNTSTTFRRAYGSYVLSNTTQPNWIVELYVNNALVSFVRTDASGIYSFQVPLVYGTSQIKLRFYGPSGEERFTEQNISIPYNFLPKNELEYNVTGGVVADGSGSKFSRVTVGYGVSNKVTIGGGTEYLSSITSGATIPFATMSARVFNSVLLSGEYDYNVRTRAIASYSLLSGFQFELSDVWYKQGQTAILNSFLEERKAILSLPIRTKSLSLFTRFTANQIVIPGSSYTTGEWLLSAAAGRYLLSANTYGVFIKDNPPYVYTNLTLTTTVFKNLLFTQQLQYQFKGNKIVSFKDQIERRIFKNGYANISIENNLFENLPTVEFGIRYDFAAVRIGASARSNRLFTRYTQNANGSVIVDAPTHYLGLTNYSAVGKGSIAISAFLDLNNNGKRETGEPKAPGLKIKLNSGRIAYNQKDTSIRVTDLEAYINYTVEIDPFSFDNIAWRLRKFNYGVLIDPNKIKIIDVPVSVVGEISGGLIIK
jgi:hypothetical protein